MDVKKKLRRARKAQFLASLDRPNIAANRSPARGRIRTTPGAAASLREGLEETLTVQALAITGGVWGQTIVDRLRR